MTPIRSPNFLISRVTEVLIISGVIGDISCHYKTNIRHNAGQKIFWYIN